MSFLAFNFLSLLESRCLFILRPPIFHPPLGRCLTKAQSIAGVSGKIPDGKMQAFVFVKPHAVTDATLKLVRQKFEEVGISIKAEGDLGAEQIERDLLIDNHYYAIANKASGPIQHQHSPTSIPHSCAL
jgi:hypothetical protein